MFSSLPKKKESTENGFSWSSYRTTGRYFWIGEHPASQPMPGKKQPTWPANEVRPNTTRLLLGFQALTRFS